MNALYYGDNLDVMRRHLKDESVDLVYLDPPFNSKANYNLSFREQKERGTNIVALLHVYPGLSCTPLVAQSMPSCLN